MTSRRALQEKSADAELSGKMVDFAAQCVMELEVEGRSWAALGARDPNLTHNRNGSRDFDRERGRQTQAGAIDLRIPKRR